MTDPTTEIVDVINTTRRASPADGELKVTIYLKDGQKSLSIYPWAAINAVGPFISWTGYECSYQVAYSHVAFIKYTKLTDNEKSVNVLNC
jgi:hypothetical protein